MKNVLSMDYGLTWVKLNVEEYSEHGQGQLNEQETSCMYVMCIGILSHYVILVQTHTLIFMFIMI